MLDEVVTIAPKADAPRGGRRRALAVIATSAAVIAAIVGGGSVFARGGPADTSPADGVAPAGTRLVGLGHAAIAVPAGWGTNRTPCGVPTEDTVVIDLGGAPACPGIRPAGVESVELNLSTARFDYTADSSLEVDGVAARRQATTCTTSVGVLVCTGAVRIPSEGVTFIAESSSGAAEVDRILSWIRIVPGQVGVPGFRERLGDDHGGHGGAYVRALERAGLAAHVRTKKQDDVTPGFVLGVAPEPGTMVRPGDLVTVTVTEPGSG